MKKISKLVALIKNYIIAHKNFVITSLAIIFFISIISSRLPYLNIIFTPSIMITVYWLAIILSFNLTEKMSFIFALIFVFLTQIAILLGQEYFAEQFGNVIFFILLIGFLQIFWSYTKKIKLGND